MIAYFALCATLAVFGCGSEAPRSAAGSNGGGKSLDIAVTAPGATLKGVATGSSTAPRLDAPDNTPFPTPLPTAPLMSLTPSRPVSSATLSSTSFVTADAEMMQAITGLQDVMGPAADRYMSPAWKENVGCFMYESPGSKHQSYYQFTRITSPPTLPVFRVYSVSRFLDSQKVQLSSQSALMRSDGGIDPLDASGSFGRQPDTISDECWADPHANVACEEKFTSALIYKNFRGEDRIYSNGFGALRHLDGTIGIHKKLDPGVCNTVFFGPRSDGFPPLNPAEEQAAYRDAALTMFKSVTDRFRQCLINNPVTKDCKVYYRR